MSTGRLASRVVVCAVLAVAAVLFVAGVVLLAETWSVPSGPALSGPVATLAFLLADAAFGVVGALVVWNRPGNLIGWLCLAVAVLGNNVTFARYVAYTLVADPGTALPSLEPVASFAEHLWLVPGGCFVLLLVVFPSGRPASRRMTLVAWSVPAIVAAALTSGVVEAGDLPEPLAGYRNALGIEGFGAAGSLNVALLVAFAVVAVVAAVDMVRRFLRSTGDERLQFKWFAYATVGIPALMVAWLVVVAIDPDAVRVLELAFTFLLVLVPVAIGIAVLRYRLYDIDLLISRTLVYGLVTVLLGAAYVALVLAGQAVFSSFAGGGDLAIAVSTLVVAALFLPVRARVQRFVDRRFYRRRYDARRTLDAFGARIREQTELTALRGDLEDVIQDTMQPAHVSVWLRSDDSVTVP
jgi:hypothetical protein